MQNFYLTQAKILDNIEFVKQNSEKDYCEMVRKIIKSDPFGGNKFYIHQFIKRIDDVSGVKKMYHHPRLTKPDPMPETTLLRVDPKNESEVTIIWTLPSREDFKLYNSGKLFEDSFVYDCIQKYLKDPREFLCPEPGDLTEDQIKEFYKGKTKKK